MANKMSRIVSLIFLTSAYIIGELIHWLPATTSKSLTSDLKFGDKNCTDWTNGTNCEYLGTGPEVQMLFSIYFVIPMTVSSIFFGLRIFYILQCYKKALYFLD